MNREYLVPVVADARANLPTCVFALFLRSVRYMAILE